MHGSTCIGTSEIIYILKNVFLPAAMDYRNIFEDAIAEWESATCIDFVRISDENIIENDYLILTDRSG